MRKSKAASRCYSTALTHTEGAAAKVKDWIKTLTVPLVAILFGVILYRAEGINLEHIDRINQRLDDRWTGSDHRNWANEMQRLNPGLKMPATQP